MRNAKVALLTTLLLSIANANSAEWLYTVRPGDTIWDLCLKYTNVSGCWYKLDKVNDVKLPKRLPPGFVIRFPVEWLKDIPKPVTVTFVSGEVFVANSEHSEAKAAERGELLAIGATITTQQGTVNLLFADGSTMQVELYSQLTLDTLSTVDGKGIVDSQVRLKRGAVKTRVVKREPASRFKITTPTAVAAVRGTEYRVTAIEGEKSETRGEVFEGLVDVAANQSQQAVAAGYGIKATPGVPLEKPRELLPATTFTTKAETVILPSIVRWKALEGARSYLLEILNDNQQNELLHSHTLKLTEFELNKLAQGCYRIRVRGIDDLELHGLATEQKICVAPALSIVELNADNIEHQSRYKAVVSWPPIANAARYRVQISQDPNFSSSVEEQLVTSPNLTINSDREVYIRVQTEGNAGQTTPYGNAILWKPQPNPWWSLIPVGLFVLVAL